MDPWPLSDKVLNPLKQSKTNPPKKPRGSTWNQVEITLETNPVFTITAVPIKVTQHRNNAAKRPALRASPSRGAANGWMFYSVPDKNENFAGKTIGKPWENGGFMGFNGVEASGKRVPRYNNWVQGDLYLCVS